MHILAFFKLIAYLTNVGSFYHFYVILLNKCFLKVLLLLQNTSRKINVRLHSVRMNILTHVALSLIININKCNFIILLVNNPKACFDLNISRYKSRFVTTQLLKTEKKKTNLITLSIFISIQSNIDKNTYIFSTMACVESCYPPVSRLIN